jgi:hypothetical protein
LVESLSQTGAFDSVILSGSIAQGRASEASDVDVYLTIPEADYARRLAEHDLAYIAPADYPGGYIDGKIISRRILVEAAERGSEPMRASFVGSQVVYGGDGELQTLIDSIGKFPEANRERNMQDFFAAASLHARYFGPQALKRDDPFLLQHATSHAVLFAGRALLAYNRILFPCPKQLLGSLAQAADLPDGFLDATGELLAAPSEARFRAYADGLAGFRDWGLGGPAMLTRFMELDEWQWLSSEPDLARR